MREKEIEEGNKLIAEFMGGEKWIPKWEKTFGSNREHWHIPSGYDPILKYNFHVEPVEPHCLKYHTSWDWQIPVLAKLNDKVTEIISNPATKQFFIYAEKMRKAMLLNNIQLAFESLVSAIQWYNTQTPKNHE